MSITKLKDGRYQVRVRSRNSGGVSSDRSAKVNTLTEARALEASMRCCIEKAAAQSDVHTFGDCVAEYRARTKSDLTKVDAIISRLETDLSNATEETMRTRWDRFIAILGSERSERTTRPYSVATLNRYHSYASAAIGQAIRFGYWTANPLRVFRKHKETPRDRVLSQDEESALLAAVGRDFPYLLPAVQFAMLVPIRKSELVGMQRSDIDQIGRKVKIRNGTTKNGRGVWVPIPAILSDHFRTIPEESPTVFYRTTGGDYWTPDISYRPLGDFKNAWASALKTAKITDFHFHDLRHQAATNLVNSGIPERIVRELANWKTDMLRTYYSFNSAEACKQLSEIWGESSERRHSDATATPHLVANHVIS